MQLKSLTFAVAALAAHIACAQDGTRIPVEDVRLLLISAIDSVSGEARGVLTGQMAKMITDRFRATGPIVIDVTTQKRYAQPGCSRLNLRFTQEGVHLLGAAVPQLKTVDIGLNYCRDGLPPKSLS